MPESTSYLSPSRRDILISLRIADVDGAIASGELSGTIGKLESILRRSAIEDVKQAFAVLGLPEVLRDACLERLRRYKGRGLLVTKVEPGSVVLVGLVSALAWYVLDKTLGESLTEGWQRSDTHERLSEFFRDNIERKAGFITRHLQGAFRRRGIASLRGRETPDGPVVIEVGVEPSRAVEGSDIPSLGQALRESPDTD